ncbi:MAG: hypothetical protein AAB471_01725, partial [Patescibacteria group bacterium]
VHILARDGIGKQSPKFPMNVMVDSECRANGPYVQPELSSGQYCIRLVAYLHVSSSPAVAGVFG